MGPGKPQFENLIRQRYNARLVIIRITLLSVDHKAMKSLLGVAQSFAQSRFYDYLFSKKIVYNACMEDPAVDLRLMDFRADSKVCVLASAGCNALHYAMDGAGQVDCVDANPCQHALVDLKLAVARLGDHGSLWRMFSDGVALNFRTRYRDIYRAQLKPVSRTFWDRNLHLFDHGRLFKGFHFRTACGFMTQCWNLLGDNAKQRIEDFFELDDMDQQMATFDEVLAPYYRHLLARTVIWFTVKSGIPSRQMQMIDRDSAVVFDYLHDHIKHSLTRTAARNNYFHYLYFFGRYRPDCCPEYLRAERFDDLVSTIDRVQLYNAYLADHLEQHDTRYSHFCLLDHLDWLHHDPALLTRQWQAVLHASQPGAKILVRTYLSDDRWMAPMVSRHARLITGEHIDREVEKDRVGIYNRTFLLEVTQPL